MNYAIYMGIQKNKNQIRKTLTAGFLKTTGYIGCIILFVTILSCAQIGIWRNHSSARRPRLDKGTVVTSRNTLLRGVYWSLDLKGELPERESVREIKNFGMNTLHVYAERHDSGVPAGSYVKQMDEIVNWCEEDGLYCVITIGGGGHNGMFDLEFARKFWSAYAPRYKDSPLVIYEIYNEPYTKWTAPYDKETLAMEQEMYDLIRGYAPDTMVLLMCYSGIHDPDDILQDIAQLKVDWSNAAVSFHGYGNMSSEIIQPLKKAGINIICSELSISTPFSDDQVNPEDIYLCEEDYISWLVFMEIQKGYLDSWRFKKEIDKRQLAWKPDYGQWPSQNSGYIPPDNLALGKKVIVSSVEKFQGQLLSGEYLNDGNRVTRWGSEFADNQYVIIDFEKPTDFKWMTIRWDGQYAVEYEVFVSNDMENWQLIFSETNGKGGDWWVYFKERIKVKARARYLKLFLKKRRMQYGFSIIELGVYDEVLER